MIHGMCNSITGTFCKSTFHFHKKYQLDIVTVVSLRQRQWLVVPVNPAFESKITVVAPGS